MATRRLSRRRRLVVEGNDDVHTILHLMKRHGYDWDTESSVDVESFEGVPNLLEALSGTTLGTYRKNLDRLGIVVDADHPLADRWAQVRDRLQRFGAASPESPPAEGFVETLPDGKRIGVWLMPNNVSPGTLEHLLATLIPDSDATYTHAESATRKARELGAPLAEKDLLKGRLHAWLAWRARPGMPFGTAITAEVFKHDSPAALAFVTWFRALFE